VTQAAAMESNISARERQILRALAAMAYQWMTDREGVVWHSFVSAGEEAVEVLEQFGLIERAENGGWNWTELGREFALPVR